MALVTLMSYVEDSPAKTSHVQEKEPVFMQREVASGGKCSGSFAWYDRNTSLWRTRQLCLTGGLMKYLGRWPKVGMMRNGKCYRQACLELPIKGKDFSSLPTPRASDWYSIVFSKETVIKTALKETFGDTHLVYILNVLDIPFQKYPVIIENMMGYPEGWTDLNSE